MRKNILSFIILLSFNFVPQIANAEKNYISKNDESIAQCERSIDINKSKKGLYYFQKAMCNLESIHDTNGFKKVISLLKVSADNSYPLAYFALGLLYDNKYERGSVLYGAPGKREDLIYSIQNYIKAAEYGSSQAQNNLGEIYLNYANFSDEYRKNRLLGLDVKDESINSPDIDKAIYWFEVSAKNGNPRAQGALSDLYKKGIGVPQDFVISYVWSNLSTASQLRYNKMMQVGTIGHELASSLQEGRDKLYSSLSEAQKDQAQQLLQQYAKDYFKKPNDLDQACMVVQSKISLNNITKMINKVASHLE